MPTLQRLNTVTNRVETQVVPANQEVYYRGLGWAVVSESTIPPASQDYVTQAQFSAFVSSLGDLGSSTGSGNGGPTGVTIDTDGVAYYDTSGTVRIALDTDGVFYAEGA